MRVYCASLATETNTFSPLRMDISDFEQSIYAPPGEHPEFPTLCSAVFPELRKRAKAAEIDLVEGTTAWAEPGGLLNGSTWTQLRDEILGQIKDALPLDVLVFGLHGAMIAENCLDCEGELLEAARNLVGAGCVIGVTFDPHSHLSKRRVENADVIVAFKEFPHIDFVETGKICVDLSLRAARCEIKPKISVYDPQMIDLFLTSHDPMKALLERVRRLELETGVLSISIIHGFMAGDSPDIGAKVVVVTDNDPDKGAYLAKKIGMELFELRGLAGPKFTQADSALERAKQPGNGPVVIADVWDNPGGGVSGDSTLLLEMALKAGLRDAALGTIWDPMAVRLCFAAGIGAEFDLRFGAKTSASAGAPIDARVKVMHLKRNATQAFGDSVVPMGDCAVIRTGGMDIVLNSNRAQTFSPSLFSNLGIDPASRKVLIVKSTNHFQEAFAKIASEIIYVAIDGIYPNDPKSTPYEHLTRPVWPIAENPYAAKAV